VCPSGERNAGALAQPAISASTTPASHARQLTSRNDFFSVGFIVKLLGQAQSIKHDKAE
jgi:hypothetical protein